MSDEGKKRPSILHPIARAKWDAMRSSYNDVVARVLPADEAARSDVDLPLQWRQEPIQWILSTLGIKKPPVGSGAGFVQSPYMDIYTKTFGTTPLADLPKYRLMFRNNPDIMAAIEMQANLAIGRGFSISHPNKEVVDYLTRLCDRLNVQNVMLVLAADCLIYGNAYAEICYDKQTDEMEPLYDFKGEAYTKKELEEIGVKDAPQAMAKNRWVLDEEKMENKLVAFDNPVPFTAQVIRKAEDAETIIQLKPLDPVYMRVRRDSYGNVFGFIQWMNFPPALIDTDSMMHIKYREKSWGYESAYGTSILMPLVKNNDLFNQFETDAAVWIHSRAVPPLIVQGGSTEKPYTTAQMTDLMSKLKGRTAASMIFTKGDVQVNEVEGAARALNVQWWVDLLLTRRYQALGVPPVLMGLPQSTGNQSVGEVIFQEFVTRLQLLQEFLSDAFETYVFYPLILKKFGETMEDESGKKIPMPKAEMVWKPIIEEDRNMRAQRLIQGVQAGTISVNEYRKEMGFKVLDDPKYDEIKPMVPAQIPSGTPFQDQKVKDITTVPEGVRKKDIPAPPVAPIEMSTEFKNNMVDVIREAKASLDAGKSSRAVKSEAKKRAKELINKYVVSFYIQGRAKANLSLNKTDDMKLKKEEMPKLIDLKKKYEKDFDKILTEMIEANKEGKA